MKKFWVKFISNKFNIAIAIIEILALISWALMYVQPLFMYFFIILQGVVFIVWGAKCFNDSRKVMNRAGQYEDLPMTSEQKAYYKKKDMMEYKNIRSRALMLIFIGAVLICLVFSV